MESFIGGFIDMSAISQELQELYPCCTLNMLNVCVKSHYLWKLSYLFENDISSLSDEHDTMLKAEGIFLEKIGSSPD